MTDTQIGGRPIGNTCHVALATTNGLLVTTLNILPVSAPFDPNAILGTQTNDAVDCCPVPYPDPNRIHLWIQ